MVERILSPPRILIPPYGDIDIWYLRSDLHRQGFPHYGLSVARLLISPHRHTLVSMPELASGRVSPQASETCVSAFHHTDKIGVLGRTRIGTGFPTTPSRLRVCIPPPGPEILCAGLESDQLDQRPWVYSPPSRHGNLRRLNFIEKKK